MTPRPVDVRGPLIPGRGTLGHIDPATRMGDDVGLKELEALKQIIETEIAKGRDNHVQGTWHIHFEKRDEQAVFSFNKCESEVYCNERPTVFATDGALVDAGGPLF